MSKPKARETARSKIRRTTHRLTAPDGTRSKASQLSLLEARGAVSEGSKRGCGAGPLGGWHPAPPIRRVRRSKFLRQLMWSALHPTRRHLPQGRGRPPLIQKERGCNEGCRVVSASRGVGPVARSRLRPAAARQSPNRFSTLRGRGPLCCTFQRCRSDRRPPADHRTARCSRPLAHRTPRHILLGRYTIDQGRRTLGLRSR